MAHQLGFLRAYGGKPGKNYGGAAYNAIMEEETKESLVLLYLDAIDTIRNLKRDREMYANSPRDLEDRS